VAYPDNSLNSYTSGFNVTGSTYNRKLVQMAFEKKAHYEYLNKFYFKKLVGAEGSGAPIIKKDDFKRQQGDEFRMHMIPNLTGHGKAGDLTVMGNEEAINPYYVDMNINQQRHAVRTNGRMSEQRGFFSYAEEAKPALTNWAAAELELAMIRTCINGWPPHIQCSTTYGGVNINSAAPRPARYWYGAGGNDPTYHATNSTYTTNIGTAETALEDVETDWLKPSDLEFLAYKARTLLLPPINTLGMRGGYILLVHPNQTWQLRKHSTWWTAQANAGPRDEKGNQIFAGVGQDGYVTSYAGIHVFESNSIMSSYPLAIFTDDTQIAGAADADVFRAILLGADALVFMEAADPSFYVDKTIDYGNQIGIAMSLMYGMGRTDWVQDASGTAIYARNLIVYSTMSPAASSSLAV